jgi:hypothetical protein
LLAECDPRAIDGTFLAMIENDSEKLTDSLFFELLKDNPLWLSTIPFLKKIAQWQFMLGNSMFEPDESKKAKNNLLKIGKVLVHEGQGRPEKVDNTVVFLKYKSLEDDIASFFKEGGIKSTSRLPSLLKAYPQYSDCFDLKGKRHPNTPKEIAIRIMVKRHGWSVRNIRAAISKNKPTYR